MTISSASTNGNPVGVLLMSYGTPESSDAVEAYYTHIRRGRAPSSEQLEELQHRYQLIGGQFPLRERTNAQHRAITEALPDEGTEFVVLQGCKHAAPFIEDGVGELVERGVTMVVGVVISPHKSKAGTEQYHERAAAACSQAGLDYRGVRSWSAMPQYLDFQAAALNEQLGKFEGEPQVVFTAHSLPEVSLVGDDYPDELLASATAIAQRCGLAESGRWSIGWQSAGKTEMKWAGPDICEILESLDEAQRSEGLIVVPQGFAADHLEVLFDLDIQLAELADSIGVPFARTATVNDDPNVMAGLATLIASAATTEESG